MMEPANVAGSAVFLMLRERMKHPIDWYWYRHLVDCQA